MFAVPGWAVSADKLVPQGQTDRNPSSGGKKRKRDDQDQAEGPQMTGNDLQKLWDEEIKGERGSNSKKAQSKKKKHPKLGNGLANIARNEETAASSSHPAHSEKSEIPAKKKGSKPHGPPDANGVLRSSDDGGAPRLATGPKSKRSHKGPRPEGSQVNGEVRQALQTLQSLPPPADTKLTPLQAKMRDKLTSARFRHLNETLYTTTSATSLALFKSSPDLFAEYHAGFAKQVKDSWPENPLDGFIASVRDRAQVGLNSRQKPNVSDIHPLPRRKTGSCTIADLGCGDAPLARALQPQTKKLALKVHSYDLHKANEFVTVADIAELPLRDGEADVAIFCLSLMGTNWISFIEEAWRILRGDGKGELWIAEVKSRFGGATASALGKKGSSKQKLTAPDTGNFWQAEEPEEGDRTDISMFVDVIERRGFSLQADSVKKANKMFVSMIFHKNQVPSAGKYEGWRWNGTRYDSSEAPKRGRKTFIDKEPEEVKISPEEEAKALKPCVYKKR